jgi:hypothetical protein
MTAVSWPERLRASPELFPIDLYAPTDQVALLHLSRIDYEKASFLDARLGTPRALAPSFAELAEAARGLPIACDYIFHVGHVGSTLMSRLLGVHPTVFSLREPLALRTFAQAQVTGLPWDAAARGRRLAVFVALYSRVWAPGQRALVKATSLVNGLAGELMALEPDCRALAMTVRPEVYLATILGGPNSREELRITAPARQARLNARLGSAAAGGEALSEGEQAAMSWACEMIALDALGEALSERLTWIDFDRFLDDPTAGLARALRALRGAAEGAEVERLAASAYFQRYSKAPEYGYGPQVRREVLAAAREQSAAEIGRGLAWLERAGAAHPAVAAALQRAEAGHVA